jgi:LmbE family N-acetylglucosaminyl deacetylase
MHRLSLLTGATPIRRVLALGAHSDDIEIGCGATMLALRAAGSVEISWVVLGASGAREAEARASAALFLGVDARHTVACHGFRDGYFPYVGGEIKDVFEELKQALEPDVIFTHARHDLHQDHRLVCELTWNTWRDHLIFEYEIPKYDGDMGTPNAFVPATQEHAQAKVQHLREVFATQRDKDWFEESLFLGLMRVRGAESRSPSGYAEAFYARKLTMGVVDQA